MPRSQKYLPRARQNLSKNSAVPGWYALRHSFELLACSFAKLSNFRYTASQMKLLFANSQGTVMEHPHLLATVRSGEDVLPPQPGAIRLPRHAKLVQLPGHRPLGIDPATGRLELVSELTIRGRTFKPVAGGC